jgi:hypothetical protein
MREEGGGERERERETKTLVFVYFYYGNSASLGHWFSKYGTWKTHKNLQDTEILGSPKGYITRSSGGEAQKPVF